MDIKEQLRSIDVKITKLANGLNVSRPTLDTYIEAFEKGEKIPNDKYQAIFEYLFSEEQITPIDFANKYDYVKRIMLADIKQNASYQSADKRKTYVQHELITRINGDLIDKESLELIFLLINNRDKPVIKLLSEYICLSNGISDWESREMTEEEKKYFSGISFFFDSFKNGELTIDEERIKMLLERNAKMNGHRKTDTNDKELINYLKANGLNTDTIDVEYIKKILSEKGLD